MLRTAVLSHNSVNISTIPSDVPGCIMYEECQYILHNVILYELLARMFYYMYSLSIRLLKRPLRSPNDLRSRDNDVNGHLLPVDTFNVSSIQQLLPYLIASSILRWNIVTCQ